MSPYFETSNFKDASTLTKSSTLNDPGATLDHADTYFALI